MEELVIYCEEKDFKGQKYNSYYVIVNNIRISVKASDNTGKGIIDNYYKENKLVK